MFGGCTQENWMFKIISKTYGPYPQLTDKNVFCRSVYKSLAKLHQFLVFSCFFLAFLVNFSFFFWMKHLQHPTFSMHFFLLICYALTIYELVCGMWHWIWLFMGLLRSRSADLVYKVTTATSSGTSSVYCIVWDVLQENQFRLGLRKIYLTRGL